MSKSEPKLVKHGDMLREKCILLEVWVVGKGSISSARDEKHEAVG